MTGVPPSGSGLRPDGLSQSPLSQAEPLAPNAMSAEQMLGPWFKEFADLGHWFDTAHGRCIRCGTPTIDIFEDGVYGEPRRCAQGIEARRAETGTGSVHESPVAESDAPNPSRSHPSGGGK